MPDRSSNVEVSYGPHLLVACTDGFASFDGSMGELIYSLKKGINPCEFTTLLSGKEVSFKPICVLTDECYNGYTIIDIPAAFMVLDEVIIVNNCSEASHNYKENLSEHGITDGVNYCRAGYKGFLEYTFDIGETPSEKKLLLSCTYQDRAVFRRFEGENAEFNQCFHISIIKGEAEDLIGAQTLCETEGEILTTIYYPLTANDRTITIRFNGSAYEGVKRGTGKLFDKVSVGYFEEK